MTQKRTPTPKSPSRSKAKTTAKRARPRALPAAVIHAVDEAPSAPASRVVIEGVRPSVDGGRFPIKRAVGEDVRVEADVFADGHDVVVARLRYRHVEDEAWQEVEMTPLVNDRWWAGFRVATVGLYEYNVIGWVDEFATWRAGLQKKVDAAQTVTSELLEGAGLLKRAASRTAGADAAELVKKAALLGGERGRAAAVRTALSPVVADLMKRHPDRDGAAFSPTYAVTSDRELAVFGAWYEMFPRSAATEPGRHGTFRDCEARLPYIAGMGFDVLYLPPIHPIGSTYRKGPNNTPGAKPGDPGSPWGIGSADGGHTAVDPQLGTMADFDRLVSRARERGIEIALDIAFQCSPDHPWVTQHPEWFRHRPDGSIQYAENPPKKYQDIYPLNFEGPHWRELWQGLLEVILFWAEHGVRIFRVDNPHTKPFAFWEWMVAEVKRTHPETIFLSEAFTRPHVMKRLAKAGFSQSYTYFTWRNSKTELIEYLTELTQSEVREYLRPNFFTNTPDILHEYLQTGGRPAFQARLLLAATLVGSYGIYGPAFELCEARSVGNSEEYQDSEKYQIRSWDLDHPDSLRDLIARVNEIRRENPALRAFRSLRFLPVDNDQLLCFAKATPDLSDLIFVAVNLDPHHMQSGWVEIPLAEYGLDADAPYQVHDLLSDSRYLWQGSRSYIALDPHVMPAHVFRVRRRLRSEHDFEYYT